MGLSARAACDAPRPARIGLLGGTFDPPHVGHLALARSAAVALGLDSVRLIPSGRPWQKPGTGAPAGERLAMVEAAIATVRPAPDERWRLEVDAREVRRDGPTYTIDTLIELREALGAAPQLVWLMGADQFANLPSWHRWRELPDHAHLAITARGPGTLDRLPPEIEALLAERGREALPERDPAGTIVLFRMPPVPVSSTALRAQLAAGERPSELVPGPVLDLIDRHGLYR